LRCLTVIRTSIGFDALPPTFATIPDTSLEEPVLLLILRSTRFVTIQVPTFLNVWRTDWILLEEENWVVFTIANHAEGSIRNRSEDTSYRNLQTMRSFGLGTHGRQALYPSNVNSTLTSKINIVSCMFQLSHNPRKALVNCSMI
jgi:hypothetical protein